MLNKNEKERVRESKNDDNLSAHLLLSARLLPLFVTRTNARHFIEIKLQ